MKKAFLSIILAGLLIVSVGIFTGCAAKNALQDLYGVSEFGKNDGEIISEIQKYVAENGADGQKFTYTYGDAVFTFAASVTDGNTSVAIESLKVAGKSVTESPIPLGANDVHQLVQADGIFVFDSYLCRDGNVLDSQTVGGEDGASYAGQDYNRPVYWYGRGENGALTYTMKPYKFADFTAMQSPRDLMYVTGYDEIYSETGTVVPEKDGVRLEPTQTLTVGEAYRDTLESRFAELIAGGDITSLGFPDVTTLDDLIAYNAEHYELFVR